MSRLLPNINSRGRPSAERQNNQSLFVLTGSVNSRERERERERDRERETERQRERDRETVLNQ